MSTVVENEVVGPELSEHLKNRAPSTIRLAHMEFLKRKDKIEEINTVIGNVSLPVHPAMEKRLYNLDAEDSPFKNGVIKYTATVGFEETQRAFLNIIASGGFDTEGLHCQVTDGGIQAMELVVLGVCGPAGSFKKPLLLIDAAYINYSLISSRLGRKTVSVTRQLQEDGQFTLPDIKEIKNTIKKCSPGGLLVIPYNNPTGQFYSKDTMLILAELCIRYNMWMISDETYRELFYIDNETTSI